VLLTALLRDGGVPGFYDGQFASLAGRFDELAALARDRDVNHVLRVMAVMALQEVGSGQEVADVLEPLVIPPQVELERDHRAWIDAGRDDSPWFIDELREANLSQHARFALAKDGQPARVREKIREMDLTVHRQLAYVLDPSIDSDQSSGVAWQRQVVFDIGYHYQQFDDFEHASEWFRKLIEALPGHRDTRWPHYNLACIAALQGRPDEALAHLEEAFKVGFSDVAWMLEDGDLRSLRERPEFQDLASRMRGKAP
jgi:tetratricopeptide (TPR) repeat protein